MKYATKIAWRLVPENQIRDDKYEEFINQNTNALKIVSQLKHLGLMISEKGARLQMISIAAQTATVAKLLAIYKEKNICLK